MNRKAELVSTFFSSIYLTIIALLQGVAIVQLVPYLINYFTSTKNHLSDLYTAPLFLTLLIIFIVWHHYVNGIIYLRWFPNIIDAIIPFAVSITEFFLISFLDYRDQPSSMNMDGWMKTFGCFLFFGAVAYFAAAIRHKADLFTNIMEKKDSIIHQKNIRKYYIEAGIFMLVQGIFLVFILIINSPNLLWISLALFVLHIVITEIFHVRRIQPAFEKGITEFQEK